MYINYSWYYPIWGQSLKIPFRLNSLKCPLQAKNKKYRSVCSPRWTDLSTGWLDSAIYFPILSLTLDPDLMADDSIPTSPVYKKKKNHHLACSSPLLSNSTRVDQYCQLDSIGNHLLSIGKPEVHWFNRTPRVRVPFDVEFLFARHLEKRHQGVRGVESRSDGLHCDQRACFDLWLWGRGMLWFHDLTPTKVTCVYRACFDSCS